ncbi:hypothetical protein ALQ97_200068 [Pseudomonas savastanoi pv. glycinea]|nr:hypothetical protein ALQ97_200068 [Pseudomonas savastanoi pv. glycinea]
MSGGVLLVEFAFDLNNELPRFRVGLSEELLGVFNEQRVDVDHMPLDLQVIRSPAQLDQGTGNDVDEAPGEFAEGCGVALAAKLPGDARRYLRDASETSYSVVTSGDLRPTQMEDIELFLTTGSSRFDVHTLEQVGIAFGVEDNDHLMFDAVDILGDVHLSQSGFADTGGAQYQGMANPFTQGQADLHLVRLDAMQQR